MTPTDKRLFEGIKKKFYADASTAPHSETAYQMDLLFVIQLVDILLEDEDFGDII